MSEPYLEIRNSVFQLVRGLFDDGVLGPDANVPQKKPDIIIEDGPFIIAKWKCPQGLTRLIYSALFIEDGIDFHITVISDTNGNISELEAWNPDGKTIDFIPSYRSFVSRFK